MREHSRRSTGPALIVALVAALAVVAAPGARAQQLLTPCEESGFTAYTTYLEMMDYLQQVQAGSLEMRLATYGQSWQGRDLPVAIFSRPAVRLPWEALVAGRPIVVLAANVHGGERTLRESLLILTREFATPGTEANRWLDEVIVLIVPSVNPDGLMAEPRPTRGNAWGIDLNRDYMKLEHPSLASYSENIINTWHPHVLVDGHNGGSQPYHICYAPTSNASPDRRLVHVLDHEIFPLINTRMEENGYLSFYYSGGTPTRWQTGGSDPRICRNYLGFVNSFGILFESPGGHEMEPGILSGVVGYKAVVEYAVRNPGKVMEMVAAARAETVALGEEPEGQLTVQQTYGPEDFSVTYQVRENRRDRESPFITVTSDSLMKKPIPTLQRDRAWAYLLPRDAIDAVALLRQHNIAVEVLQDTCTIEVQAYRPAGISWQREYNHDAAVVVEVAEVVTFKQRFPAGTYVIPTAQLQGRVAAHLLEPETNDNVVRWNRMDAWLPLSPERTRSMRYRSDRSPPPPPRVIPIYKVLRPVQMPTRLLLDDPGD